MPLKLLKLATPPHEFVVSERFSSEEGPDAKAIRGTRYKLIRYDAGGAEFYDLEQDEHETQDLLQGTLSASEQAAHDELDAALSELIG